MASDAVVHLIDDDDGVRQSVAFLLTTAGFAVRVYDSATAFIEALQRAGVTVTAAPTGPNPTSLLPPTGTRAPGWPIWLPPPTEPATTS